MMNTVILSDTARNIAFIQVWTTPTPEDQQQLLQSMKAKMGMFKHLPGFISMSLHPSLDGTQIAVYAQWRSREDFEAAVTNNPQIQAVRREFTKYGEYSGTLYTLDAVQVAEAEPATGDLPSQIFAHHRAEVNDVCLHYVAGGTGDPVILLHGNSSTWYEWHKIMPRLAQHYTVIAPDLRGFGDSSRPESGYDKRTLGEDIYQLAIRLGFERFFLVGHDWGGPTAYALAAAHPEAVRRLAIVESIIPGTQFAEADAAQNTWFYSFHQAAGFAEALIEGREREYLSWCYQNFSANPAAITAADIDEYIRAYSIPGSVNACVSLYRTVAADIKHNQENLKRGKLQMPVLALGADQMMKDSPLISLQQFASDVRGGMIEDCGHYVPEEQPDYLVERLISFFTEQ
jgi:pimeloyl-ACP methyl ester carboxylesterase/heme-degrading monooxygenase HmoA